MTPFDVEALAAIAQLGLGLAGFSGIGLLLTRTSGRLQRFELYRLGIMLGTAIGATFLALVPMALGQLGLGAASVCRFAAATMAVFSAAFAVYFVIAIRYFRSVVPEIIGPVTWRAMTVGHGTNCVVQSAATFGWLDRCPGWYVLGLLWLLGHGTYQFWRIISVRPREDET